MQFLLRAAISGIVLCSGLAMQAHAQAKSDASRRWTVNVGAQSGITYDSGTGWRNALVEFAYEFQGAKSRSPFQSAVFLENAGMGSVPLPGSDDVDVYRQRSAYGLGFSGRGVLRDKGGRNALYAGAGGGLYRLEVSREFRSNSQTDDAGQPLTESFSEKVGARLGWKVFAGLQVKQSFLEIGWRDLGKLDNVAYRSASLSFGHRF